MIERNITLDYTKLILSFLVVTIHNPILSAIPFISNLICNGVARLAVPCFFIINGLYLQKTISNKTYLIKYIKKLLLFYTVWMLIYAPFHLFGFKDTIEKSIFLNIISIVFGYWHLWYLIGLIGGVALLYYFKKKNFSDKKILLISMLFFFIGWLLQQFRLFYPNTPGLLGSLFRANFYYRNFAFLAFPLITAGYLISKEDFMTSFKKKLSNVYTIACLFILLFLEVILHYFMVGRMGFDFYLALFILCPALIIKVLNKSKIVKVESDYISKLSAVIFFIHPLILFSVQNIFPSLNGTQCYVLIIFFSFLLGSALIDSNRKLKIFF